MKTHQTITDRLLPDGPKMNEAFVNGCVDALERHRDPALAWVRNLFQDEREAEGFQRRPTSLLTPPAWNLKLDKGETPAYGLTLQHTTTRVRKNLIVNACPHAGDCQKVCVLDNGNGMFNSVQRARRAKTRFLVNQPRAFAYLLGYELARAQMTAGPIYFRPNVNSDISWELILPSMTAGEYLHHTVLYGYTKNPAVLATNGWMDRAYRLAYSWNENTDPMDVGYFLSKGGSVAVVTSRKKGSFERGAFHLPGHPAGFFVNWYHHVDADLTDEWMFQEGVIGDLSAKGRARKLIGVSGFVVSTGEAA